MDRRGVDPAAFKAMQTFSSCLLSLPAHLDRDVGQIFRSNVYPLLPHEVVHL